MAIKKIPIVFVVAVLSLGLCGILRPMEVFAVDKKYNPLTPEEEKVIINKGTMPASPKNSSKYSAKKVIMS